MKKLVKNSAFATGKPTELLDEIISMCQIMGDEYRLNETIGLYTCTQDCEAPYNYTEVLSYDNHKYYFSIKCANVSNDCPLHRCKTWGIIFSLLISC